MLGMERRKKCHLRWMWMWYNCGIIVENSKTDEFSEKFQRGVGGWGHFQSKNLGCGFLPFGTFPKIHLFWKGSASLMRNMQTDPCWRSHDSHIYWNWETISKKKMSFEIDITWADLWYHVEHKQRGRNAIQGDQTDQVTIYWSMKWTRWMVWELSNMRNGQPPVVISSWVSLSRWSSTPENNVWIFPFSTQFDEECTEWVVDWPKVKREGMPGSPWPWKPNSVCTSVSRGYVSRCRVRGCRLHPVGSHFVFWSGSRIFFHDPGPI